MKISIKNITQYRLKKILDYDQITGLFRWKNKPSLRAGINVGDIAGCVKVAGYRVINCDNERHYAHRLAWLFVNGKFPIYLDHINGIRSDNRIENLREATHSQNGANCKAKGKNNLKGICFLKDSKKMISYLDSPWNNPPKKMKDMEELTSYWKYHHPKEKNGS